MAFVYYKHAEIDRRYPRALAVCDRCGMVYNHTGLRWQYDWMGAKMANLRILVCPTCQDKEQEQRRQIVLPRDPIPIEQPRIEPAISEMGISPPQVTPGPFDPIPSWDATRIPGQATLSNYNLTATSPSTDFSHFYTLFSDTSNTDKRLFSVTAVNGPTGMENFAVGVANSNQDQTAGYLGDSVNGVGFFDDGTVFKSSAAIYNIFSYSKGDTILAAVDAANKLIWFQLNGQGNWNNSGTANPVTGIGGLDISFITGPVFTACSIITSSAGPNAGHSAGPGVATLNCFPTETVAGFAPWGETIVTVPTPTPVPADTIDPTADLAGSTPPSSYFAFNQDLGSH